MRKSQEVDNSHSVVGMFNKGGEDEEEENEGNVPILADSDRIK